MRVSELDYELPEERIAQEPASDRGSARLYALGEKDPHRHVRDLPKLLPAGSLVVVNDTRVIPARILGHKEGTGGKAEVFLLERAHADDETRWHALGRASKGVRVGMVIASGVLRVRVDEVAGGMLSVHLTTIDGSPLKEAISANGHVPLPPYIKREDDARDRDRYQTMFAKSDGAVAAPTAGLHLTPELVAEMRARDIDLAEITLHVGLGTFQPVTAEDLNDHSMHSEWFSVSDECRQKIAAARERGAKVVAIGTTTVRALESAADAEREGHVRATSGKTSILIQPGSRFHIVDLLLTNFHLPKSTLLALVSAFAGRDEVLSAYKDAVIQKYRFFSYGDAMLLTKKDGAS